MSYPPPLLKHPAHQAPTPASSQSAIGATLTANPNFVPRKEFIKNDRVASSFSLLTFASSGFVRLYDFSAAVTNNLRRLFNSKYLISSEREQLERQFHEFTLEGRPWANPKSIKAEKLIVDILTVILHSGYAFLSTIDYGRESDDKLAIAFSIPKPLIQQNHAGLTTFPGSTTIPNGSLVSLAMPIKTPFAISFSSATLLRVVGPPLHSTPAVLQAVRGAWPRGVVSEKKVGDATYEFKLKGYKWFQEDTFPVDSLNHILGLLSSLDNHGFTLLTSLSFTTRTRAKDFWVFTGVSDEHNTPPSTPTTSHFDSRRELTPRKNESIIPGPIPWPPPDLRGQLRAAPTPAYSRETDTPNGHARIPIAGVPATSSPLRPKQQRSSASPPISLSRTLPSGSASAPLPGTTKPKQSSTAPQLMRSLSNPSSVGSVDMTGVGRRSMSMQRTPDVFYVTDGRQNGQAQQEHNPFQASLKPNAPQPHAAFIQVTTHDRRASVDSTAPQDSEDRPPIRPSVSRSSTLPMLNTRQKSSSSTPRLQIHAPSPISAKSSDRTVIDEGRSQDKMTERKGPPTGLRLEDNRSPTPPLLTPGTFRDSAFSSSSHHFPEKETSWTKRIAEMEAANRSKDKDSAAINVSGDSSHSTRNDKQTLHLGAGTRPDMDRVNTAGPSPPGGWMPTSREDRNDVSTQQKMFPPTIREQPSQEGEGALSSSARSRARLAREQAEAMFTSQNGDAAYKQRGDGAYATEEERQARGRTASPAITSGSEQSSAMPKPKATRRDTAMSGWVMVNVERPASAQDKQRRGSGGHKKSSSQTPPPTTRPTVRHRRSNSDSGLYQPNKSPSPVGNAPAPATMSAAAKTIAMIDAVDAKEKELEKANAPSGFRRIFQKARGIDPTPAVSPKGGASGSGTHKRRAPPEGGMAKNRSLDADEADERTGLREKLKMRGTPPTAFRGADRRMDID